MNDNNPEIRKRRSGRWVYIGMGITMGFYYINFMGDRDSTTKNTVTCCKDDIVNNFLNTNYLKKKRRFNLIVDSAIPDNEISFLEKKLKSKGLNLDKIEKDKCE